MESTSQETNTSSQRNQGTSLSALIDAIALQEQCFEQSLASQQLWSQQLVDKQEVKIKEAVQKTAVCAVEVNEILKGEKGVALEVKTEEFDSERGKKEWEPRLQPPPYQLSRSKSRSTSLFQHPEVFEEHRRFAPDVVSKRDLGNFDAYTCYDHHKDRQRSSYGENTGPSGDNKRRLHAYRRSSSTEGSRKRERRSPSKSKPQMYCRERSHSSRSGSFRCESGDSRGRNYRRKYRSPVDDGISHHRRSVDSRKRRGASPFEIRGSRKSRDFWAEDRNNDHEDYSVEKIIEPPDTRSRFQSQQTAHGNSHNYATSETDRNGPESMRKTEHGPHKQTNISTKFCKTQETDLKDMIVKKKEVDETKLVNKAFDCRDAKHLPKDPTGLTCNPLPERRSKWRLEPQERKRLGSRQYRSYDREES